MEFLKNFIGGELLPPLEGKYIENLSPATGEVYSQVPASNEKDVQNAISAASKAFPAWSSTSVSDRALFLRKIANEIEKRKDAFALAESIDTGKPLSTAYQVDISRSIQNFIFFSEAISQFSSDCYSTNSSTINYTLNSPLGVVGCISPWNLPLYLLSWKLAPALAAGNTVVAKPSEVTPMTAFLLSQVCTEVGLPPGVLNIVHGLGSDVGKEICQNSNVAAISFTGSTKTGAEIAKIASPLFKKLSLEMGGKNPTLVFSDADFEKAIQGTIRSAFSNQGQICLCGSRIFVEDSIYERFKATLIERISALKIGDPLDSDTEQGSVVSEVHFNKIMQAIETAKNEGGKILTGGRRHSVGGRCSRGWFISPTLVENLDYQCQTNQEEIFGPVATITPFSNEKAVVKWANSTQYGLAASVWTNQLSRAHRLAAELHAGLVWLNCWMVRDLRTPFGGMKASGLGREGGFEALKFFSEVKNICMQIDSYGDDNE